MMEKRKIIKVCKYCKDLERDFYTNLTSRSYGEIDESGEFEIQKTERDDLMSEIYFCLNCEEEISVKELVKVEVDNVEFPTKIIGG